MAFVKKWKDAAAFYDEFTADPNSAAPADNEQYFLQASTVPAIVVARGQLAMWRGEIWSNDFRIIAGLDAMVSAGIITEARKNEILGS